MNPLIEKFCRTCKTVLPLETFGRYLSGPRIGRTLSKCQDCKKTTDRSYMAELRKDPDYHANEQALKRKSTAKRRQLFDFLKMERGCYDCGSMLPAIALDWDHAPGTEKRFNIGPELNSHPLQEVIVEVDKCQVVCANCHRIRTMNRKQEGK